MSPQIAAEERLRRLAPLVAALAGLAMGLAPTIPATPSEAQVAAAVLVAVAAGLVAHAIAAARGAAGVIGGAAAGVWVAAVATAGGGAGEVWAATTAGGGAGEVWAAATLATAAGAGAVLARAAMPVRTPEMRAGDPPIAAAPAAVTLVVMEPRAWAVASAIAALVALRDRGRRRLLAVPAMMAATGAGVITLLGALGRAPAWAPGPARMGAEAWLEGAVDVMGPLAMVLAAVGVMSAAGERRARWLTVAIGAAMAAMVPLGGVTASGVTTVRADVGQLAQLTNPAHLAPIIPPTALVGAGLALGVSVAAAAARVGRPRHQMVAAAAITALMIAPFAL